MLLFACHSPDKANPGEEISQESALEDSGIDTTLLPDGDNLIPIGSVRASNLLESTGTVFLNETTALLCSGAGGLEIYDLNTPAVIGQVNFPNPAGGRCQHLALASDNRILAVNHGDELSDPWIGLADLSNPLTPLSLASWSQLETSLERLAVQEDSVWVAAHKKGLLKFDIANNTLTDPSWYSIAGNAHSVAASSTEIAVGTLEGEVIFLNLNGVEQGRAQVSGSVLDLLYLPDGSLVAACGSSGLDRLLAGEVVAHTDGKGAALDVDLLGDGMLVVASWLDFRVYTPTSLELLGAEVPVGMSEEAAVFAVAALGTQLAVGEWQSFYHYQWDASVSAPDISTNWDLVDFGTSLSGEAQAFALVLENEGPKLLQLNELRAGEGVTVDRQSLEIKPGQAEVIELQWTSSGQELRTNLEILSNDPDEPQLILELVANRAGVGVGDPLPSFNYISFDGTQTWNSANLGGPVVLSYFATF